MPSDAGAPLILVADDDALNIGILGELLEATGYAVVAVSSGPEAVRSARLRRPDLILLDVVMPGMDGRETCRALRDAGFEGVPVICITGCCEKGMMVDAFAAGAIDYVTKPILADELLARIRTHLDLKMARDRLAEMLREREEIMHVVAHDLKNPISAALFAARLLRDAKNEGRRAELIDDVAESADQALRFIQRFLSGGSDDRRLRARCDERIDLGCLLSCAARQQSAAAESRGIEIVVRGEGSACVDVEMTQSVAGCLLSNAIRYGPANATIDVDISVSRLGDARFVVMDRGPGLSDVTQDRVFRRFTHLISAGQSRRCPHSSGLGLAMAKRDVLRLGGHLWYEPRPGGGSIFGVEFPQRATAGQGTPDSEHQTASAA